MGIVGETNGVCSPSPALHGWPGCPCETLGAPIAPLAGSLVSVGRVLGLLLAAPPAAVLLVTEHLKPKYLALPVPGLNDALDRFVTEGLARNLPLTLVNHPDAPHAFDLMHDSDTSREIIRRALAFMQFHLGVAG